MAPVLSKAYYSDPDQSYPYYTIYDDDVSIYKDDGKQLSELFKKFFNNGCREKLCIILFVFAIYVSRSVYLGWLVKIEKFQMKFFTTIYSLHFIIIKFF